MPQATRDIQRRIKSVKNTKKITKAMELVAASKMRKAVAKVLSTRAYSDLAWQTVLHLAKKVDTSQHPFFQPREEIDNVAVILVSTNRGLCGSFNAQVVKKVVDSIKVHHPETRSTDIITCGTKGRDEARRSGLSIVADFAKEDITISSETIRPISHMITKEFLAKKYDRVFVAYMDFQSSLRQIPHVKQLLPIVADIDERLGHITHEKGKVEEINVDSFSDFLFEPSTESVLDAFLPRLVEMQVYQAVLESEASEHSARMMAMRNASDAANEMIDELTLVYNQARQAGITAEIAEIAAGSAALE
ncbi:ATP synthase F1 subunit gamma [Candidatus Parcubacteria bacterium]|nr:MAG: ATP synthase F1 subunit gamma [Candidatus Parcubacteria bacterium]